MESVGEKARKGKSLRDNSNLKDSFGQIPVIFFSNLGLIGGSVEDGWIIIHVLHIDHHRRGIFILVIRCSQS